MNCQYHFQVYYWLFHLSQSFVDCYFVPGCVVRCVVVSAANNQHYILIYQLSISFNAYACAAAVIAANCSSAVPCILMSVFCRVCLAEFGLRSNCRFLNLKKFPLLLLLDIAGHILVFNRGSLHTWRVISSSCVLSYLSNII